MEDEDYLRRANNLPPGPSSGYGFAPDDTTFNPYVQPWVPVEQAPASLSAEELRAQRARASRQRYMEKKKAEKEETALQLEQGRKEIERLKLERETLIQYGDSLASLGSYAACMLQALTEARNSAARAVNAGIHGLEQVQDWTRHQYVMIPSAVELMTTTLWTPTESQMRWVLHRTKTEEYENGHQVFFDRIAELLKEGERNPSAQQRVEKRVEALMTLWLKFTMILVEEKQEHIEYHLCAKQVGEFKQHHREAVVASMSGATSHGDGKESERKVSPTVSAAAVAVAAAYEDIEEEDEVNGGGGGASGSHSTSAAVTTIKRKLAILPSEMTELGSNFLSITPQQKQGLSEHWKKFKKSVQEARKDLGLAVGAATAAYVANINFVDGSFAPDSSASMAESFLTTADAAQAADAFVKRESRAYMELFVNIIQLLSPLQLAYLKTAPDIQPLIPHLPLVCHLLLQEANVMGSSGRVTPANNTSSDDSADKDNALVNVPQIQMIKTEDE